MSLLPSMTIPGNPTKIQAFVAKANRFLDSLTSRSVQDYRQLRNVTETGTTFTDYIGGFTKLWDIKRTRDNIASLVSRMLEQDPEIQRCLDSYVHGSLGLDKFDPKEGMYPHFRVKVVKSPGKRGASKIEESIQEMLERTRMFTNSPTAVGEFVSRGNSFWEIVLAQSSTSDHIYIEDIIQRPEENMWPNINTFTGRRLPGYVQTEIIGKKKPIEYLEWQIVHWTFGKRHLHLGTSFLYCLGRIWNRLAMIEDSVAWSRLVRSVMRLRHYVPIPMDDPIDEQEHRLQAYRDKFTEKRYTDANSLAGSNKSPMNVDTDVYCPVYWQVTYDGKVQQIRGDVAPLEGAGATYAILDDVEYLKNAKYTAMMTPRHFINADAGRRGALTESGLDRQDAHYAKFLRDVQRDFVGDREHGLLKVLYLHVFLEFGILPEEITFLIELPKISLTDEKDVAAIENVRSKTILNITQSIGVAVPMQYVLQYVFEMTEDEIDEFMKDYEEDDFEPLEIEPGMGAPGLPGRPMEIPEGRALPSGEIEQSDEHPVTTGVFAEPRADLGIEPPGEGSSSRGGYPGKEKAKSKKKRARRKGRTTAPSTGRGGPGVDVQDADGYDGDELPRIHVIGE